MDRTENLAPEASPQVGHHPIRWLSSWACGVAAPVVLIGLAVWWYSWTFHDRRIRSAVSTSGVVARGSRAERGLRDQLARAPDDGALHTRLARILAARGDFLGSARELHKVPSWWPSRREALYLAGECYLRIHRARMAESAWLACMGDGASVAAGSLGHRRAAGEGLIKLYATQERWDDARRIAWDLMESSTMEERPDLLFLRMRIEVERIAPETRVERLSRYVEADPDDFDSRLGLARAEHAAVREAEATRHIRRCLATRPNLAAWSAWLEILQSRGDAAVLAEAVRTLPSTFEDGKLWACRAQVLQSAGDQVGAAKALRRAAELRPHDEDILYRLAVIERLNGRPASAEPILARSQSLRRARMELLPAVQAYHQAMSESRGEDIGAIGRTSEHLASLCETLGLNREARAIRSLIRASDHSHPASDRNLPQGR